MNKLRLNLALKRATRVHLIIIRKKIKRLRASSYHFLSQVDYTHIYFSFFKIIAWITNLNRCPGFFGINFVSIICVPFIYSWSFYEICMWSIRFWTAFIVKIIEQLADWFERKLDSWKRLHMKNNNCALGLTKKWYKKGWLLVFSYRTVPAGKLDGKVGRPRLINKGKFFHCFTFFHPKFWIY